MSAQQAQIDLIFKWAMRLMIGVSAFLIAMYINDIRNDINSIKLDVRAVMSEQASQRSDIKNLERVVYK